MFCSNCGTENKENAKFCGKCGAPLETRTDETVEAQHEETAPFVEKAKLVSDKDGQNLSRKKPVIIAIICIFVILACIISIVVHLSGQKDAEYNEKLQTAQQYVEDMDYDKAETAYLDAIDIEPKREEAYLELSDVYVVQEEFEAALEILEEGKENTGHVEAFEKQIEAVEEKSEGKAGDDSKAAQYQAYYELVMEYQDKYGTGKTDSSGWYLMGCSVIRLLDFNKDGNEELIIGYLDEENPREDGNDGFNHKFEVWAWHDEKLVNALPATLMLGQGAARIATAIKDDIIYMETYKNWVEESNDKYYFQRQYLQYEDGEFITKYDYVMTDYTELSEYFVNGEQVSSREEFEELTKDFPKTIPELNDGEGIDSFERDNGLIYIPMHASSDELGSILEKTEETLQLLQAAKEQ